MNRTTALATAAALALAAVFSLLALAPATAWAWAGALLPLIAWFGLSIITGLLFALLAAVWCYVREVPMDQAPRIIRPFWIVGSLTGAIVVGYYLITGLAL